MFSFLSCCFKFVYLFFYRFQRSATLPTVKENYVIAAGIAAIQKPRMANTKTHPCDWIPASMLE
jgi:hypothetical protein